MKIIANAFLSALVAATMAPSSTEAMVLSIVESDKTFDIKTRATFHTEQDVKDSPESLTIVEQCMIMTCNESHGEDYHMVGTSVKSSSHSHKATKAEILGKKNDGLRGSTTAADDDWTDDDLWWTYNDSYDMDNVYGCNSCPDDDDYHFDSLQLAVSKKGAKGKADGKASHAEWEKDLCDCLGQTDIFAGAHDCKIEFVEVNVE